MGRGDSKEKQKERKAVSLEIEMRQHRLAQLGGSKSNGRVHCFLSDSNVVDILIPYLPAFDHMPQTGC